MREAERQILIAFIELEEPFETANNRAYRFFPKTLEEAAAYFGVLREDWSEAYPALVKRGYLTESGGTYALTAEGKEAARQERLDHPPIYYWYREFYPLAASSQAYALFCRRLYGANFYQAGFSDLEQVDFLIQAGRLNAHSRILDLGCGLGNVIEFLSDRTGARAWGLDYAPESVRLALARTLAKRERLDFLEGNLDHLEGLPEKFNTLLSIDTLYMTNRLVDTLGKMGSLLEPGGQMLVYYSYFTFHPAEPRERLTSGGNPLGQALAEMGLAYQSWDFSEATFHLMRRKHHLALEMASDFEAEGNGVLLAFLLDESDPGESPFDPSSNPYSRYLYRILKP